MKTIARIIGQVDGLCLRKSAKRAQSDQDRSTDEASYNDTHIRPHALWPSGRHDLLSFISMYALMHGMVNTFANVYMNVNQFYMAGLMAAPMGIIELALMGAMYRDKKLNSIVTVGSFVALAVFWVLLRQQTAVSDTQFLRSMIPHHAGATGEVTKRVCCEL